MQSLIGIGWVSKGIGELPDPKGHSKPLTRPKGRVEADVGPVCSERRLRAQRTVVGWRSGVAANWLDKIETVTAKIPQISYKQRAWCRESPGRVHLGAVFHQLNVPHGSRVPLTAQYRFDPRCIQFCRDLAKGCASCPDLLDHRKNALCMGQRLRLVYRCALSRRLTLLRSSRRDKPAQLDPTRLRLRQCPHQLWAIRPLTAFDLNKLCYDLAPAPDVRRNRRALCFELQAALTLAFGKYAKVGDEFHGLSPFYVVRKTPV